MTELESIANTMKVLSEPIRLEIIGFLSSREMCACQLLEHFSITQSTLSHHMKVLSKRGLVSSRKDKTWMFYSLNKAELERLRCFLDVIISQPASTIVEDNCT